MQERRKYTRLPLELAAEIRLPGGTVVKGRTNNISFGGIFFQSSDLTGFKPGDRCFLSIILQEDGERLSIDFNCEVIHLQGTGTGLGFISIDGADAYNHFRNLMVMNSPEPDKLLEELELHPGIILKEQM